MEKLFFKPIIMSIDYMDAFEKKEVKRVRQINKTWCYWLIN